MREGVMAMRELAPFSSPCHAALGPSEEAFGEVPEERRPGDYPDRAPFALDWCDQHAMVQEDLGEPYDREVFQDGHVLGVHVL